MTGKPHSPAGASPAPASDRTENRDAAPEGRFCSSSCEVKSPKAAGSLDESSIDVDNLARRLERALSWPALSVPVVRTSVGGQLEDRFDLRPYQAKRVVELLELLKHLRTEESACGLSSGSRR